MALIRKLAAEFIGTFWLVLGGCGSAVLAAAFPHVGIGLLGVALAFGLSFGSSGRHHCWGVRSVRSCTASSLRSGFSRPAI